MKPNFAAMTRKELRAYLLAHRDDEEAFFAHVDRSEIEANWIELPPLSQSKDFSSSPNF